MRISLYTQHKNQVNLNEDWRPFVTTPDNKIQPKIQRILNI